MFNDRKHTMRYRLYNEPVRPPKIEARITGMDIFTITLLIVGLYLMARYAGWF